MLFDMDKKAPDPSRGIILRTAFHEAGHAVVGNKLGLHFTHVDMKTDSEIVSLIESASFKNPDPDDFGCVHFDDPILELVGEEPSQLKNREEFTLWIKNFRINAINSLAGEVAEYKRPNSLEDDSLKNFLEGHRHHQELTEMLESAFHDLDFSLNMEESADNIMEGCITKAEKMVTDHWQPIEALAGVLLNRRKIFENEVNIIIHKAEKEILR